MTSDKVKGEDDPPKAEVNVTDLLAGKYKVTAPKGIRVSGHEGTLKKGDEVDLNGDAARALMNEGSVERA
jgi:hypothetical protein